MAVHSNKKKKGREAVGLRHDQSHARLTPKGLGAAQHAHLIVQARPRAQLGLVVHGRPRFTCLIGPFPIWSQDFWSCSHQAIARPFSFIVTNCTLLSSANSLESKISSTESSQSRNSSPFMLPLYSELHIKLFSLVVMKIFPYPWSTRRHMAVEPIVMPLPKPMLESP